MGGRSIGAKKKVRHHVNPLKDVHMQPIKLADDWPDEYYADPTLPIHVDIGCARGVFCLDLASLNTGVNVAGLEIRSVLAEAAQEDASHLRLGNVAFFGTNANANLERVLQGATSSRASGSLLRSASIQFPDPWFKARHQKRRVVQPDLVRVLADHLPKDGWLWMQSDVLDVAQDMRETVRTTEPDRLQDAVEDFDDWTVEKPSLLANVATERERSSAELNRPVYRCLFRATGGVSSS